MVFNFNPLLKLKLNRDNSLCHCKYSSPRNIYLEGLEPPAHNTTLEVSVCSRDATRRGAGQKVISFSIFGKDSTRYMRGLLKNIKAIKKYYPHQYIIRIYFDERRIQNKNFLCDIFCVEPNLDLCNVNDIGKLSTRFCKLDIIKVKFKPL